LVARLDPEQSTLPRIAAPVSHPERDSLSIVTSVAQLE
jgi:hypothetical protein